MKTNISSLLVWTESDLRFMTLTCHFFEPKTWKTPKLCRWGERQHAEQGLDTIQSTCPAWDEVGHHWQKKIESSVSSDFQKPSKLHPRRVIRINTLSRSDGRGEAADVMEMLSPMAASARRRGRLKSRMR